MKAKSAPKSKKVHNPAPWKIVRLSGGIYIDDANGHTVANLVFQLHDNEMANAKLIACSPDLLSACKAIDAATKDCGYDCRQGDVVEAIKLVRTAVAKAEGRANV